MDHAVIDYISRFISLSEEEKTIIKDQNLFRHYPKNEILLKEGSFAKECYFIIKGCIRAYYLKDGEEKNTEFYFENQTVRPLSYQTNSPSVHFLSCLEDCIVAVGSEERNRTLIQKVPKLTELVSQMTEAMLVQKTQDFDHFKNHSPEERYLLLQQQSPELLVRIPLFHLASYLGITKISLSRIRRRIHQKKSMPD